MKEEFLHFIWKNSLFENISLRTVSGSRIVVIDPGQHNSDSGPDFFNSRIMIGSTEWAGNIEIHLLSSAWDSHGHNNDHAYDNVILHVVAEHDREVYTAEGRRLDTLILTWDKRVYHTYKEFLRNPKLLACRNYLNNVDRFLIRHSIHREAVERINNKSEAIRPLLDQNKNNWEETLYWLVARYFGMKVNSEPFIRLAQSLPLRIMRKHLDNTIQVEALLFGQSGLLEESFIRETTKDEYYRILVREYRVLKSKYNLVNIESYNWKFHRIRPTNFPTVRISQLADLLVSSDPLFQKVKNAETIHALENLFMARASSYWRNHFRFGKLTETRRGATGSVITRMLIINVAVPLLFLYGVIQGKQSYCDRAIDLADSLKPEDNSIIRIWNEAGVIPVSAFESQGLISLYTGICKNRQCLNCLIGSNLISLGKEVKE